MDNKELIFKVPSFFKFNEDLKTNEVAITLTEAEFIADQIAELNKNTTYGDSSNGFDFYNEFFSIISDSGKSQREQKGLPGITEDKLKEELNELEYNCMITSLEAYLREAIKSQNRLKKELDSYSLNEYKKLKGYVDDDYQVDNIDFYNDILYQENLGTLSDYFKYQTYASFYGNKVLHKNGLLSIARNRLRDALKRGKVVTEVGKNIILTEYESTIPVEKLDEIFFKVQGIQRDHQVEFNSLKTKLNSKFEKKQKDAINEGRDKILEVSKKNQLISNEFNSWRLNQESLIGKLKIVIPNDFIEIYRKIKAKLNR